MGILAPSILSADFTNLAQQIRMVEIGGADWIHCDVMDGHFAPNLSMGPAVIKNLTGPLVKDVHLMLTDPSDFFEAFAKVGADIITFHAEAVDDISDMIRRIKSLGVKAGISINPSTSLDSVLPHILELDHVLIMSVEPGFSGQKFMPEVINKIVLLIKKRAEVKANFKIGMDGGINADNIKMLNEKGVDQFGVASAIFSQDDIIGAIKSLM